MMSKRALRSPLSKEWKTSWLLILVAVTAMFSPPLLAHCLTAVSDQAWLCFGLGFCAQGLI